MRTNVGAATIGGQKRMSLWGIKYSDVDDRWWVDLICQEEVPEVRYLLIGARAVADGFEVSGGRLLVRKASIRPEDLAEWPSDRPTRLAPPVERAA